MTANAAAGRGAERRNLPFVELAQNELIKQGVSPENIEILQPQVSGTIYEAQLLRAKLEETSSKSDFDRNLRLSHETRSVDF